MTTSSPITLNDAARDVARAEAQAVLAATQNPRRRERLAELIADLDEGAIKADSADALEEILELGLQTGRVRAHYGPEGEHAALTTFRKLPRGQELAASAGELTDALQALAGQRIDQISVDAAGPGAYVLRVATDSTQLAFRLDRQGARLHSVGV